MGKWAVHNWHVPAREIDDQGRITHDGKTMIHLPEPLFTADTREEAEEWRLARIAHLPH